MRQFSSSHRRIVSRIAVAVGLVLAGWFSSHSAVAASEPDFKTTTRGIAVKFGDGWMEAAADETGALRLSISHQLLDGPPVSTFTVALASETLPVHHLLRQKDFVGIVTAAGALLLEPGTGSWLLQAPDGRVIVPRSTVKFTPENPAAGVMIAAAWPREIPFFVYGSGNGSSSLQQLEGSSGVANGRAVIPYYWSKAGYAALAVSVDDGRPASWAWAPVEHELRWSFPGTEAHLYLMPSANLKLAAASASALTGRAPVPPRWTFGYLQSRWGWRDRADIEETLREFRSRRFPVDAFIFDFEWYTPKPDYDVPPGGLPRFPDFEWNPRLFPEPARQLEAYRSDGVRFVGIRKPRLGDEARLKLMHEKGWALHPEVQAANTYHARDMDFRNPEFRRWYGERIKPMARSGIAGWWNDEGESTFVTYYYWNQAEREAARTEQPGQRFWSLNRAFSPGLQRLGAAAWTGDLHSTWKELGATPTSLLNWSLAGMTYSASDIGGFREETTPELLARWMEAGVFFPIMRTHASHEWTPRFPWRFGSDAEAAMRKALELRYRLVPYYYSLAHEANRTGVPLMRPMAMEFPEDPRVANLSDQWMVGANLLAAPVLHPARERTVYLPTGLWYRFETTQPLTGAKNLQIAAGWDDIPVYLRAGTILPLAPTLQSTKDLPGGPLELQIYPGKDAAFTLTEDDGETDDYLRGDVRTVSFAWNDSRQELSWQIAGPYQGSDLFHDLRVELFGPSGVGRKSATLQQNGTVRFPR